MLIVFVEGLAAIRARGALAFLTPPICLASLTHRMFDFPNNDKFLGSGFQSSSIIPVKASKKNQREENCSSVLSCRTKSFFFSLNFS